MPALPPERPGCPAAPGGRRPLPDLAMVRLCLVPDSAPPYDDEVPTGEPPSRGWSAADNARPAHRGRRAGGDRLADGAPHGSRPAAGAAATPAPGRPATAQPATGGSAAGGFAARGPSGGAARGWQSRFAQVLAETLAGSRPARQIVPWTTQQAREHIQRLGPRMASAQRPRVRRVVTYRPASDVMEMAVVVGFGPRVRALAVRLERSATPPLASRERSTARPLLGRERERSATHPPASQGEPAGRWVCTAVEAA